MGRSTYNVTYSFFKSSSLEALTSFEDDIKDEDNKSNKMKNVISGIVVRSFLLATSNFFN